MIESLTTYEVAAFVHDAVWQRNGVLPDYLLAASSLRRMYGHMTNTEQVVGRGGGDPSLPTFEMLSKGRNGLYYFQATEGFKYVITPSSGPEIAQRFASSIIISEFMRLTEDS